MGSALRRSSLRPEAPAAPTATPAAAAAAPAAQDQPYQLIDRDGAVHPFDAQTQLYVVDDRGRRKGGAFKTLQIDLKTVRGELADGTRLVANLDRLDRAELDMKDVGTGVAMGLGLGLALIAIIVVGAMAMNGLP